MSATLKRIPYIRKFGIAKYWVRSRGRKPSPAEVKLVKTEISGAIEGSPEGVRQQPEGLAEYQGDVATYRRLHPKVSFVEAKAGVNLIEKWERRRKFREYPSRVQRYIKATYDKGQKSGKIGTERDLMEWVGKS